MVKLPFKEEELEKNVFLRSFSPDLDDSELKWHIDLEDRLIESQNNTDWKFQFDNQLPIAINGKIFIPAGVWHRLIKGNDLLQLKITKLSISNDI